MLQNPEYTELLLAHNIKVPEEYKPGSEDQE